MVINKTIAMNNILILREGAEDNRSKHADRMRANLIILMKDNGAFEIIKNITGSNGQIGRCGELLDIDQKQEKP